MLSYQKLYNEEKETEKSPGVLGVGLLFAEGIGSILCFFFITTRETMFLKCNEIEVSKDKNCRVISKSIICLILIQLL
jgi:hypothetical protein